MNKFYQIQILQAVVSSGYFSFLHHIIIPPLPESWGEYTVLPLSVLPSSKIFFVACFSVTWWQKSDIWSQVSYRYTILWVAFFYYVIRRKMADNCVNLPIIWSVICHSYVFVTEIFKNKKYIEYLGYSVDLLLFHDWIKFKN